VFVTVVGAETPTGLGAAQGGALRSQADSGLIAEARSKLAWPPYQVLAGAARCYRTKQGVACTRWMRQRADAFPGAHNLGSNHCVSTSRQRRPLGRHRLRVAGAPKGWHGSLPPRYVMAVNSLSGAGLVSRVTVVAPVSNDTAECVA
jgi:hypothetical protein